MKYASLPSETLAEILLYIAEKESFASLRELGSVTSSQLKAALAALAQELKGDIKLPPDFDRDRFIRELKPKVQDIFRQLSPDEQNRLIRSFIG